jgi:hypothetical protein
MVQVANDYVRLEHWRYMKSKRRATGLSNGLPFDCIEDGSKGVVILRG